MSAKKRGLATITVIKLRRIWLGPLYGDKMGWKVKQEIT